MPWPRDQALAFTGLRPIEGLQPYQAIEDERLSAPSAGERDSSFCKGQVKVAAPTVRYDADAMAARPSARLYGLCPFRGA
jgi:hypothetical protein